MSHWSEELYFLWISCQDQILIWDCSVCSRFTSFSLILFNSVFFVLPIYFRFICLLFHQPHATIELPFIPLFVLLKVFGKQNQIPLLTFQTIKNKQNQQWIRLFLSTFPCPYPVSRSRNLFVASEYLIFKTCSQIHGLIFTTG